MENFNLEKIENELSKISIFPNSPKSNFLKKRRIENENRIQISEALEHAKNLQESISKIKSENNYFDFDVRDVESKMITIITLLKNHH